MKIFCPICGNRFETNQGKCPICGSELDKILEVLKRQQRVESACSSLKTDEIEELFELEPNGTGYAIREYLGLENKVYIPSRYRGKAVNRISQNAFEGADIEEVVMPISVREIGASAFNGCFKLKTIRLSEMCRSIGEYAFCDCTSLENIYLPDSVKEIDNHAFSGCINLKRVKLPSGLEYVNEYLFENCQNLDCLALPMKTKTIGSYAFLNCYALSKFKFSKDLTSIGDFAFSGCIGLKKVILPDNLVKLGNDAFYDAKGITHLYIGDSLAELSGRSFYGADNLQKFKVSPNNKTYKTEGNCILDVGNVLILGTPYSIIPSNVVGIQREAFCGYNFTSPLLIPDSVRSVEGEAFFNNNGLLIEAEAGEKPNKWAYNWLVGEGDVKWGVKG